MRLYLSIVVALDVPARRLIRPTPAKTRSIRGMLISRVFSYVERWAATAAAHRRSRVRQRNRALAPKCNVGARPRRRTANPSVRLYRYQLQKRERYDRDRESHLSGMSRSVAARF